MTSTGLSTVSSGMTGAKNYARWILDEFHPYMARRILEVGLAGLNYVSHGVEGQDYLGVDIDPEVVACCTGLYPRAHFLLADVSAPAFPEGVGARRFDTVLCVNVLEHIQDDRGAIRNLLAVLEPGGHLLLFVPAFPALYTDLDRLAGHVRRYTQRSLAQRLPSGGVAVEKLEYFNPLGALGWWAQRFVRHQTLEHTRITRQIRLFDRLVVPISRRCNGLTRSWFGQSVISVIRKVQ